jgi:hypothetical protein
MSDGAISGNSAASDSASIASSSGGAVFNGETSTANGAVSNGKTFTMSGGKISGNSATATASLNAASGGGGVYSDGTFTMSSGEISGNSTTASSSSDGGGVYTSRYGAFEKTGDSIIYGDTDATHTAGSTENTAINGRGHAVFMDYPTKQRNSTAGAGVMLDSTIEGSAGGWE